MKANKAALAAIFCISFAAPVFAADNPYSPEFMHCMDNKDPAVQLHCARDEQARWEKQLNEAYAAGLVALAKVDAAEAKGNISKPSVAKELKDGQTLWTQYRSENCRLFGDLPGKTAALLEAECQLQMTADRAQEIKDIVTFAQ